MSTTTTRLALQQPVGADASSALRVAITGNATTLDDALIWKAGTFAARPAANTVPSGRIYKSTDIGQYDLSDGTNWTVLIGSRGATNISTTESRTNTAYGLLTTPDKVTVTLPTNGLIAVAYQATWQESANQAARAAIFLGATQQTIAPADGAAAPKTVEAGYGGGGIVNTDRSLCSFSSGLASTGNATAFTGDVTTGQAIGAHSVNVVSGVGSGAAFYVGGGGPHTVDGVGGPCVIFAAAGTYDVSVQFKASSGSVTAKNRKLWVWTAGF